MRKIKIKLTYVTEDNSRYRNVLSINPYWSIENVHKIYYSYNVGLTIFMKIYIYIKHKIYTNIRYFKIDSYLTNIILNVY